MSCLVVVLLLLDVVVSTSVYIRWYIKSKKAIACGDACATVKISSTYNVFLWGYMLILLALLYLERSKAISVFVFAACLGLILTSVGFYKLRIYYRCRGFKADTVECISMIPWAVFVAVMVGLALLLF